MATHCSKHCLTGYQGSEFIADIFKKKAVDLQ